jgi:S-adenosylmethionine hydrolase
VARPIVFCSDYGLGDEFVGVCHGVIARLAPQARIIDLTHGITRHDVAEASMVLARSVPFMPPDSIFLAVVDPGVGSERRPVAAEVASGAFLVGPDNGLFGPVLEVLGGASRAVQIASPRYLLSPVSNTFHGRDVFAPAAAHLANGLVLGELGPSLDVSSLVSLDLPKPEINGSNLLCSVLGVDGFGNVQLNVGERDLDAAGLSEATRLRVETPREHHTIVRARTFADVPPGDMAALIDSSGFLALVVNRGDASEVLKLERGDGLVLAAEE